MPQTYLWRYRTARRLAGLRGGEHDVAQSPVRAARTSTVADQGGANDTEFDGVVARGASAVAQQSKE